MLTVWEQRTQLNLNCAAPLESPCMGSFPLAKPGESPCTKSQWDEASIQTQFSHWLTTEKKTKTNSKVAWGFPHATPTKECYTNNNKGQSSMGFPHATTTKARTKVAWVSHMLHQQQSKQNKTTWRQCKVTVKQNGGQMGWMWTDMTWNGCGTKWWKGNMNTTNKQIQTNSTNSQLVQEIRSVPSTNNCNKLLFST